MIRRWKAWKRFRALARVHRAQARHQRYMRARRAALQQAARDGVRPGESWDEFVYRIESLAAGLERRV
ncbi:hypothetical protein GS982_20065 [Rhodococcus hoagii]|nr:hypothetical protein [Prescottella equi]NKZ84499.1 hypothetical protein [Prescottella equi]